jgi:hypothetical protein
LETVAYLNFLDWKKDNRSFTVMAAYREQDFNLTGAGKAERLRGQMISAVFFVANLLFGRGVQRSKEMSVRMARGEPLSAIPTVAD